MVKTDSDPNFGFALPAAGIYDDDENGCLELNGLMGVSSYGSIRLIRPIRHPFIVDA